MLTSCIFSFHLHRARLTTLRTHQDKNDVTTRSQSEVFSSMQLKAVRFVRGLPGRSQHGLRDHCIICVCSRPTREPVFIEYTPICKHLMGCGNSCTLPAFRLHHWTNGDPRQTVSSLNLMQHDYICVLEKGIFSLRLCATCLGTVWTTLLHVGLCSGSC